MHFSLYLRSAGKLEIARDFRDRRVLTFEQFAPMMRSVTRTPLTIVLPCFNEQGNVSQTVRDVDAWIRKENLDAEIIAVDDGSRDQTGALLKALCRDIPSLRVLSHPVNEGYGAAIRTGCDAARKENIAFMDSDGQFRIEDVGRLLPCLAEVDFVAGRRRHRADSFVRNIFGKVLGTLIWIAFGLWVRDVNCGMKVFRRSLWYRIRPLYGLEKLFNTELFLHIKEQGVAWCQVDVPHYPRRAGNPTGAKLYVIARMFHELWGLWRAYQRGPNSSALR